MAPCWRGGGANAPLALMFSLHGEPQGFVPFFVSATAGTTVYGAFDPLIAISDICRKHGVWMHVDVSERPVEAFHWGRFRGGGAGGNAEVTWEFDKSIRRVSPLAVPT